MRAMSKRVALRVGLYDPARDLYQAVRHRDALRQRRELKAFYATFIANGDRVFDIGANRGEYSVVFASLGASVVAVEPNPRLAGLLRRRLRGSVVVECALGSSAGHAELYLGSDEEHSTISSEWAARRAHLMSGEAFEVTVCSLDDLIAAHGMPRFVKIDVEGHEYETLRGLTHPVPMLQFEYQSRLLEDCRQCIELIQGLGSYELGIPSDGAIHWERLQTDELIQALEKAAAAGNESGDLFARLLPVST
jgi:FkbM family methyltransferase